MYSICPIEKPHRIRDCFSREPRELASGKFLVVETAKFKKSDLLYVQNTSTGEGFFIRGALINPSAACEKCCNFKKYEPFNKDENRIVGKVASVFTDYGNGI